MINSNEVLMKALEKWGIETQVLIWIEEMSELIKVLAKRNRLINPSYDSQIEEELADVDICLDQMKLLYPSYEEYKNQKMARLKRLIEASGDKKE